MAESKIRDDNYYQVAGWMLNRLGLKGTALQVYAIIYGFSQDGESSFTGSIQYLCDFTGASRSTVKRALQDLVDKGYIRKTEVPINGVPFNSYRIDPTRFKMNRGVVQNEPGEGVQNEPSPQFKMNHNNKSLDNKDLDNKEDREVPLLFEPELQSAFSAWLQYKEERKEAYKPTGLQALITEIKNNAKRYGEEAVAAEIRTSMIRGWRGIIFDRLKEAEQKAAASSGRREPDVSWMKEHIDHNRRMLAKKTAGNDPAVAARAEELRRQLGG